MLYSFATRQRCSNTADQFPIADTPGVGIAILVATFVSLSSWLTFVRGRFLRSRTCVECNEAVARDGTEHVAGYRCRIWHAQCYARAVADERVRFGVKRSDEEASRREDGGKYQSGSGRQAGRVDEENGELEAPRFAAGDRPRLSLLICPRPTQAAPVPRIHKAPAPTHNCNLNCIASGVAPVHSAKASTYPNDRELSVHSHTGSIEGVLPLPVPLRKDDPTYASRGVTIPYHAYPMGQSGGHSMEGRASDMSSITITLPASHHGSELEHRATSATNRSPTAMGMGSWGQRMMSSDTASIHSAHTPSPLRTSMVGVPAPTVARTPSLPVSPRRAARQSLSPLADQYPFRYNKRATPLPADPWCLDYRTSSSSHVAHSHTPAAGLSMPAPALLDTHRGSGGYFDPSTSHTLFELPATPRCTTTSKSQVSIRPFSQTPPSTPPTQHNGRPEYQHGHRAAPRMDFSNPTSVHWRDTADQAIQRLAEADESVGRKFDDAVADKAAGEVLVHGVEVLQMPDPARYTLWPIR